MHFYEACRKLWAKTVDKMSLTLEAAEIIERNHDRQDVLESLDTV